MAEEMESAELSKDEEGRIVERALQVAAVLHKGAKRKGHDAPYIIHPVEVVGIIYTMTKDPEIIAAGALHDVVEDTPWTGEDVREVFGERVAQLVCHQTENKRHELPAESTWQIRKEEALAHYKGMPLEAKYITLADKLSNIRASYREFQADGIKIWDRFNEKDPAKQAWYYRGILDVLSELSDTAAYREYGELVEKVFAGY